VTFDASTGVLSGTPAATTGGTYNLTFTASNGIAPNATENFTLTVNQSPAIISANNSTFTVGTAGSFTVISAGFPAPTLSESGTLPPGVTFNASTGVLSGTPTSTGSTYNLTFTASNGIAPNAAQSFTLTVNNIVPVLDSVSPTQVNSGSPPTTLVASGSQFIPQTVIQVNGTNLATTFNSSTTLMATIPSAMLASAATLVVTVSTPAPGGGASTAQNVLVLAVVAVSPPSAAPVTGANNVQFSASVSGTTDQNVTWTIIANGVNVGSGNSTVGTISSTGLYSSPAYVPYPAGISVQATSNFDNTGLGTAGVTVKSPVEDWPKYHRDLANTGQSAETGINSNRAPHLQSKWVFTTRGKVSASPAVATINGTRMVFVGSWDGVFHALDAATGAELWSFPIDLVPVTGACMNPDDRFACTRIGSSAAVANGKVYFGAGNGYVYCLNAATGALVWKFMLGDATLGAEIWESPAVYSATIGGVTRSVVAFAMSSHNDTPCFPGQVELFDASTGLNLSNAPGPLSTFDILQGCPAGQTCVGGGTWSSPAVDVSFSPPIIYIGTGNPGTGCSPPSTGIPATAYTDGIAALDGTDVSKLLKFFQPYISDPNDQYDFGSSAVLHSTSQCTISGNSAWVTEVNKWGTVFTLPRGSAGFTSLTAIQNDINPDSSLMTYSGETIATPALITGSGADCNDFYLPSEYGFLWKLQQAGDGTGNVTNLTTPPWPVGVNLAGGCMPPAPGDSGPCPMFSAPAAVADVLVFGGGDGNLYIFNTSGAKVFAFGTSGLVASGPVISDSRIYFGSFDKNIYCLSVDGK
jgi:outer membrane protein assembly factor BamB